MSLFEPNSVKTVGSGCGSVAAASQMKSVNLNVYLLSYRRDQYYITEYMTITQHYFGFHLSNILPGKEAQSFGFYFTQSPV
jgi:hypothetical protein